MILAHPNPNQNSLQGVRYLREWIGPFNRLRNVRTKIDK